MLFSNMSWPNLQTHIQTAYAITPVGTAEPHGPHRPLAADTVISEYFAVRLAHQINGLITPSIANGLAGPPRHLGDGFPGVTSIGGRTFPDVVTNVLAALARHGVRKFVFVNSAIDNVGLLWESARILTRDSSDSRVAILNWWDVVDEEFQNRLVANAGVPRTENHHVALMQSSLVMYIASQVAQSVHVPTSAGPPPDGRTRYRMNPLPPEIATESSVMYTTGWATAQLGELVAKNVSQNMVAAVRLAFGEVNGELGE
ncbi:hypothetical protein BJF79_08615 [Actinomadura sp. CNU-125]|uniref:creatininase family protein n=1 Tax=Actinomadura sp. CNU-125 TaxID=1904961 RepID=UPI00095D54D8|nr:creatininase family protein [Actinomadura sp. CNU-125]OLT31847.1 hypothetical protein BJF79_08615 [Actinomadura sp. CNU-125]